MIPLPRPAPPPGACQDCGTVHVGACYLAVPIAEKNAIEQIERNRRAHAGGLVIEFLPPSPAMEAAAADIEQTARRVRRLLGGS